MAQAELNEFQRHLRGERGLSPCTWQTHGYQLRPYLRLLEDRGRTPATATTGDVLAYLESRKEAGIAIGAAITAKDPTVHWGILR